MQRKFLSNIILYRISSVEDNFKKYILQKLESKAVLPGKKYSFVE